MKRLIVKYTSKRWAGEDGWEATLTVDGETYARVSGRDYIQVAIGIQGYVMNLAGEANPIVSTSQDAGANDA